MLKNFATCLASKALIYLELGKWRVTSLMLITVWVGMVLASSTPLSLQLSLFTLLGVGLVAISGGALNHLLEQRLDKLMARTDRRPLPLKKISTTHVLLFSLTASFLGLVVLSLSSNLLTCFLSFISLIAYAFIYTLYLKRHTTQNIVIGGLAGATPPLLGWTAVTGNIDPGGLILVLIIFIWTPPHFWSLAIARHADYVKSNLPMLPVTHGIAFTKQQILLYTLLLSGISLLPFCIGMSGIFYLIAALLLNTGFIVAATDLLKQTKAATAIKTFHYSNFYLLMLFACLFMDHTLMRTI
ncbi:protoheme IX farnesyltransferase [Candidatus Rickettsiella isopodorum]|jgi:protoheme IX farnesyltransferase|uniref:Protoheme IX farnesyltransferase n=1 Tax=Candidatus Rickettsiella isopodorum TaxID=1225476 RepID=A0A1J8NLI3_9COXI|nr:heme o synthase [Candidatus Rickettsiella isopodorum]MCH9636780.1 heme o synthase [Gammaproteobacteria bacterium]MDQ5900151.1 Protoheme farnesyltransferase [Pseudomonadota bacterium]MCH9754877.1 heme o synthase [Gammaproteobacteria bacterium]MDD4892488.1 heme o synthase [Candidatus Rickettsiella isopodorum]MDD5162542.1 heme o synthase [Candidatus Rickettsiella isopodorum]